MAFSITILGSNSAVPVYGRHHTAQYLQIENNHYLLDCGEGAQLQMQRYGLKPQKLNAIFISHLHGDHYLGLAGLLSTLHLQGRSKELHLYGPPPLADILTLQFRYADTTLRYPLHFHPLDMHTPAQILDNKQLTVRTLPLQHRIDCVGFVFEEKPFPLRLNKEKLPPDLSLADIATLKKGQDITDAAGNIRYRNRDYTLPPKRARSYAYLTDTLYLPHLAASIQGVDMLYHEATFLTEKELKASQTYHATAGQAALLAKEAAAGKLLLGHFSARYKDLQPLLAEARKIFEESYLAIEGETFYITH